MKTYTCKLTWKNDEAYTWTVRAFSLDQARWDACHVSDLYPSAVLTVEEAA